MCQKWRLTNSSPSFTWRFFAYEILLVQRCVKELWEKKQNMIFFLSFDLTPEKKWAVSSYIRHVLLMQTINKSIYRVSIGANLLLPKLWAFNFEMANVDDFTEKGQNRCSSFEFRFDETPSNIFFPFALNFSSRFLRSLFESLLLCFACVRRLSVIDWVLPR